MRDWISSKAAVVSTSKEIEMSEVARGIRRRRLPKGVPQGFGSACGPRQQRYGRLVVISHGLWDDPVNFEGWGAHLASHALRPGAAARS